MATVATLSLPITPPDYHRIISPTLRIPADPSISIPVGILACQRDPLLRQIDTFVVSCSVSQTQPAPAGKKAKKAVLAPTIPDDPILEVILHDTVIFPEGGGQPTDTGILRTSDGTVWDVVQAKRHGGHAVHYVRVRTGDVNAALLAFLPGEQVTAALDEDGYARRYDHMSMHTSQHLLSALLETRLNLPTLSWSLTASPAPCYVEIPRGMSIDEITSVQQEANRLVFEGRRIHVEVEELDRDQEQGVPTLESGRSVGKALPQDYTGGVKRVVIIDGVDKNPCCGTHLPSIHNLQLFLLPHTDALSRSTTTSARLYFLSGPRLISHLSSTHTLLTNTASLLSCGTPLVPERVGQVVNERKRAEKRVDDTEHELAKYIANDLLLEIIGHAEKGQSGAPFRKHLHRNDDTGNALGFLSAISLTFIDTLSISPHNSTPYLIVLTSSPSAQTTDSTTVLSVLGTDAKEVKTVGDALKARVGAKGGGRDTKWSGKFSGVWKQAREGGVVDEVLNALVTQ